MSKINNLALEWCNKNIGWVRSCDIENIDSLYKTWDDLNSYEKNTWINNFNLDGAREAWEQLANRPCKVDFGFINEDGEFTKVIPDINYIKVYKVDELSKTNKENGYSPKTYEIATTN